MTAAKPQALEVWLLNQHAGTLWLKQGQLTFQYSAPWLKLPGSMPLSWSLPLQGEPFNDQECRPFFAGLLPEGQLRQRLAQQCQISRTNDFGLLAAIGGDCAGAVSLRVGDQAAQPASVEWLEPDQLIALLDELLPHLASLQHGLSSLAIRALALALGADPLPGGCRRSLAKESPAQRPQRRQE